MAKDDRLYARFDIAMDEHPKIMLLSDAAFRALHEATYYSRRQLTDGFIDERVALKKWRPEVIEELSSNHPERPSWVRVEGGWQIWDYAEHQTTNADIQAKKAAGRLGGLAKAKRSSSKPVAPASDVPLAESKQTATSPLAITETEKEKEITTTSNELDNVKPLSKNPYPDDFEQWWQSYPRREAKGDALKAWKQLKSDRILPDVETLIAASETYARRETRSQFRKLPGGWLRGHKWLDEEAQPNDEPEYIGYRPPAPAPAGKRFAVDVATGGR